MSTFLCSACTQNSVYTHALEFRDSPAALDTGVAVLQVEWGEPTRGNLDEVNVVD